MSHSLQHRLIRLSREGVWIAFGQAAVVAGGIVSVRVLTELLDPSKYGEVALAVTIAALVNQTLMGGLSNAFARYYAIANERNDLAGFLLAAAHLLGGASCLVVLLAGLVVSALMVWGHFYWLLPILLLVPLSISSGWVLSVNSVLNSARKRGAVSLHSGLEAWLRIACAVAAIKVLGPSLVAVLAGFTAANFIVVTVQVVYLKKASAASFPEFLSHRNTQDMWNQELLRFAWPFSVWGVVTWAQQCADRWALGFFGSLSRVGEYNVAYQLGYMPIMIISNMAISLIVPVVFARSGSCDDYNKTWIIRRQIWAAAAIATILTLFAFIVSFWFHQDIFRLLAAKAYEPSSIYLPWLVLAGGLFAVGQVLTIQHLTELDPRKLLLVKVVTAIIGIALVFGGAYVADTWGVVVAVLAFGIMYLASVIFSILRRNAAASGPSVKQLLEDN